MTWWTGLRAYLLFAAMQGFGIGLTGLDRAGRDADPDPRHHAAQPPVCRGAVRRRRRRRALAALRRRRSEARLFVVGFWLATLLILILTIVHWSDFMADPLPHRPLWIFDYVPIPLLAADPGAAGRAVAAGPGTRHALTPLLIGRGGGFRRAGLACCCLCPRRPRRTGRGRSSRSCWVSCTPASF